MRDAEWYAAVIATDIRTPTDKRAGMRDLILTVQREAFDAGVKAALAAAESGLEMDDAPMGLVQLLQLIEPAELWGRP